MRESDVYGRFEAIKKYLTQLEQSIRLDSTGKEIRLLAFQKVLLKKGLMVEQDMTDAIGEVMKEMQEAAEKAQNELVKPTVEQTQVINEQVKTAEPSPVIPPPTDELGIGKNV